MQARALDLFHAYTQGKLRGQDGYIVTCTWGESSSARYEITGTTMIRAIALSDEGLYIQANGNKLYVIIEPFPDASVSDPPQSGSQPRAPLLLKDLSSITTGNNLQVMISKEPVFAYGSFMVAKPVDKDFIFFKDESAFETMHTFFAKTLEEESFIPQSEAQRIATEICRGLDKFQV